MVKRIKQISAIGIIAALYVALCVGLAPLSYGGIQFRISEILLILPFYNKKYCVSLILGTFIANIFSPMGIYDIIFGTAATVLVCIFIIFLKNKDFIALIAALVNGVIIGAELYFVLSEPLLVAIITVAIGEFVVVQMGALAFAGIEKTNSKFITLIKDFI